MSRRTQNSSSYRRATDSLQWTVGWKVLGRPGDPLLLHRVGDQTPLAAAFDALLAATPSLTVADRAECAFLMRVEGSPANAPQFYVLSRDESLRAGLAGTTIIEYPIIQVVQRAALPSFNVVPKPPPKPTSLIVDETAAAAAAEAAEAAPPTKRRALIEVIGEAPAEPPPPL